MDLQNMRAGDDVQGRHPEIDEDGCYFLCIGCGHHNVLVNVGAERGEIALAQPAD